MRSSHILSFEHIICSLFSLTLAKSHLLTKFWLSFVSRKQYAHAFSFRVHGFFLSPLIWYHIISSKSSCAYMVCICHVLCMSCIHQSISRLCSPHCHGIPCTVKYMPCQWVQNTNKNPAAKFNPICSMQCGRKEENNWFCLSQYF